MTWIYFVGVVVIGSFFLLNLVTAVLCDKIGESISVNIPTLFTNSDVSAVITGAAVDAEDASKGGAGGTGGTDAGNAGTPGDAGGSGSATDDGGESGKGKVGENSGSGGLAPPTRPRRRSTFLYAADSIRFLATPSPNSAGKNIMIVSDNTTLDDLQNSPRPPTRIPPSPTRSAQPSPPPSPRPESPVLSPSSSTKLLVPKDDKQKADANQNAQRKPYDRVPSDPSLASSPPSASHEQKHKHKVEQMDVETPTGGQPGDPTPAAMLAGMFSGVFADVYTNYFPETFRKRVTFVDRVVRPRINAVLSSFYFELAVFLIVLIHTIILATQYLPFQIYSLTLYSSSFFFPFLFVNRISLTRKRHWDMNESHKNGIFVIDRIFIGLFTVEVLMRIFGAGIKGYPRSEK